MLNNRRRRQSVTMRIDVPARPAYMADVEAKAEFYARQWGLEPGQVKLALHDIFSMLSLHNVGPYVDH